MTTSPNFEKITTGAFPAYDVTVEGVSLGIVKKVAEGHWTAWNRETDARLSFAQSRKAGAEWLTK